MQYQANAVLQKIIAQKLIFFTTPKKSYILAITRFFMKYFQTKKKG